MNDPLKPWDLGEAVAYYQTQRHALADLYESERVFFASVMARSASVLDVGCAAGGTSSIIREVNPAVRYVGVDVSPAMVGAARALFPDRDFRLTRADGLEFPDGSFDTVLALGVLNHVPDYPGLLREMYRVAKRYVLVDLPRLVPQAHVFDPETSHMVLKARFGSGAGAEAAETRVPYVVADAAEVFGFIRRELAPARTMAKGYFGRYNESVVCPFPELCFAVACLCKQGGGEFVLDMPIAVRQRLTEMGLTFAEPFGWMLP
jgi:ubiquinone/menaquinone biosynthesis C-methylase UbiE